MRGSWGYDKITERVKNDQIDPLFKKTHFILLCRTFRCAHAHKSIIYPGWRPIQFPSELLPI